MAVCKYLAQKLTVPVTRALMMALWLVIFAPASPAQDRTAHIGVLAYRGVDVVIQRWQPLVDYLNHQVEGWRFELVPVTLVTSVELLEASKLDFLATNPGHFVSLRDRFGLSAIATREAGTRHGDGILQFGTVILVQAGRSDLRTLADLKGKTLVAVSPDAFGGFQMAWYEFHLQGIDPFKDLASIRYIGFPQDAIVDAVISGEADAGVVRSGLIEAMTAEGRLEKDSVRALLDNTQLNHPFLVSSRLYPEWAVAMHRATDRHLAEAVAAALLRTQQPGVAASAGLPDKWSVPMSYEGVREVLEAYQRSVLGGNSAEDGHLYLRTVIFAAILAAIGFAAGLFYARRRRYATPSAAASDMDAGRKARFDELTQREREILSRLCRGERTKQIADALHISPRTVEYHRMNLLQKTRTRTTPRMVRIATQIGFDRLPEAGEKPVKAP
ncbi:MAG: PhnD/SsuA/transferrin family substrate-binding protein [Pseudomonadota bacterium]|nr:PhnD/SsuA/transferrin family substrate-binding protein [Pseudomonadota bacterium]